MGIELTEVIEQLRGELTRIMHGSGDAELVFEVGAVDLEFTVTVTRDVSTGSKIKFWVADAHVDGKIGDSNVQRVKLSLQPRLRAEPAGTPLISGESLPDER